MKHINDREPNFYSTKGKFFLVKCYNCNEKGTENYAPSVSSGICSFCGWDVNNIKEEKKDEL